MEISNLELIDRYETVFQEYVELAPKLADFLEKYGRTRKELEELVLEMRKRNLPERDDAPEYPKQ